MISTIIKFVFHIHFSCCHLKKSRKEVSNTHNISENWILKKTMVMYFWFVIMEKWVNCTKINYDEIKHFSITIWIAFRVSLLVNIRDLNWIIAFNEISFFFQKKKTFAENLFLTKFIQKKLPNLAKNNNKIFIFMIFIFYRISKLKQANNSGCQKYNIHIELQINYDQFYVFTLIKMRVRS